MAHFLVVYGTSYGQTAKVVRRLSDRLVAEGHRVSAWKGDAMPEFPSLEGYDALVVAGSVRFGRYQPYLAPFVRAHLPAFRALPSAFLSVCGAMAGKNPRGEAEARNYIANFERATGWHPRLSRSFAGGLPYTQYGAVTRWMMKLISRQTGRPTDTSRDWEFTDWGAVDQFARDLSRMVSAPVGAGLSKER